ncbi:hypothetical protein A3A66_00615 [Microgenomates group bacterium RIFCSPLOWO2_01_FULL_46_13]|nr:MAG: hypothetical protein A2783_04090 [Microgenomates group bacterium RIFCSPHIGHO2_01_FULL_45_11]OGV94513.1 MAG: hypothetical protein A3A66_00615 [Microgenomates group bacterium RIFCSPLOWO2_01_FULL_46_13]
MNKTDRVTLSVVVATHNEAAIIKRCLAAVKKFADELVVVDGESTDETVAIAKRFGARVIQTSNKPIFHLNKQLGLEQARGEWVLQLDADEVVSEELGKEIAGVIEMSEGEIRARVLPAEKRKLFKRHQQLLAERDGYKYIDQGLTKGFFVPRRNFFLNRFLRYGGTYPDGVIRLVRKQAAYFPSKSVHEQMVVTGRVDWLVNDLLHYDSPTLDKYWERANRYTTLTAKEWKRRGLRLSFTNTFYYLLVKPVATFGILYIRHKGFLDGLAGFLFALFSGLHFTLAYFKYWEMRRMVRKV